MDTFEKFWKRLLGIQPCYWCCSKSVDGTCNAPPNTYRKCKARLYQVERGWIEDVFQKDN